MMKDWTLVRLRKSTVKELERVRASMLIAEDMGLVEFTRDPSSRVGLDQIIMRLVAFRDKHAERAKRSRSNRRRKSVSGSQGGETASGNPSSDLPAAADDQGGLDQVTES